MKEKIAIIIIFSVAAIFILFMAFRAYAYNGNNPLQCNENNPENCPLPSPICDNGEHVGNPHCATPTPSASPTASPSATPVVTSSPTESPTPIATINPCDIWKYDIQLPCPTNDPTASPSATPSATPGENVDSGNSGQDNSAPNRSCELIHFAPTVTSVSRNNPTSIHVEWSKVDDFVSDYVVQYGLVSGIPLWNTVVTGNQTDLNFLPFNHVLWVRVFGTQNGCLGAPSEWIDP